MRKIAIALNLTALLMIPLIALVGFGSSIGGDTEMKETKAIGIIGGADGPTSIYVSSNGFILAELAFPVVVLIALIVSTIALFKNK